MKVRITTCGMCVHYTKRYTTVLFKQSVYIAGEFLS